VTMETLTPSFNLPFHVRTALGGDLTRLVPRYRVFEGAATSCDAVPALVPALRAAGVAHVLSLDAVEHPDLRLVRVLHPGRIAPLAVHAYDLADPRPLLFVAAQAVVAANDDEARARAEAPLEPDTVVVEGPATVAPGRVLSASDRPGRWQVTAEADGPTLLVVREAYAAGWSATVNGRPAPVIRADGRHLAVPLGVGRSEVALAYRPPRLLPAYAVAGASLLVVLFSARPRRAAPGARPSPPPGT
jgi:hypothetical protein